MDLDGRVRSADGVEIAWSARGGGETALVFIHGGLADREFWAPQLAALAGTFRVVALDLAGHGSSGRDRKAWTMEAFGRDASAVVEALPIRAINGDLWPTDVQRTRTIASDFDAVIMKGAGHYPMLERPEEFNGALVEVVTELTARRR